MSVSLPQQDPIDLKEMSTTCFCDSFTDFCPCSLNKMNSNWYFSNCSHEDLQMNVKTPGVKLKSNILLEDL